MKQYDSYVHISESLIGEKSINQKTANIESESGVSLLYQNDDLDLYPTDLLFKFASKKTKCGNVIK